MKRRTFITALFATAAIAIAEPAQAFGRRRGRRARSGRRRGTVARASTSRSTSTSTSYRPTATTATPTHATRGRSISYTATRNTGASVNPGVANAPQPDRNAARVSYRWRRPAGGEQVSTTGRLTTGEIKHLSTFGPQRAETYNRHLNKRSPESVEQLPDGSSINWYRVENPDAAFVDSWQGEGQSRTYSSQPIPSNLRIGLKFDRNGNYKSMGISD